MSSNLNILLIDNRDSFTYNLVQCFEELNCQVTVQSDPDQCMNLLPSYNRIVFSPGPGLPEDFPIMFQILQNKSAICKILGICLGHQAIAQFFGASLYKQQSVQHGRKKLIYNKCMNPRSILYNMPSNFEAGLYHSWAVKTESVPDILSVSCISDEGVIMGLIHNALPIEGIQFHPESFLTNNGLRLLENWIKL